MLRESMTSGSAESVLQEAATDEAWPSISAYISSNTQEVQVGKQSIFTVVASYDPWFGLPRANKHHITNETVLAVEGCQTPARQAPARSNQRCRFCKAARVSPPNSQTCAAVKQCSCLRPCHPVPYGCVSQHVNSFWASSYASDPASHASTDERPCTWRVGTTCAGRHSYLSRRHICGARVAAAARHCLGSDPTRSSRVAGCSQGQITATRCA